MIAFCGQTGPGADKVRACGIDAIFPIMRGAMTYKESMRNAGALLEKAVGAALAAARFKTIFSSPVGVK